jgi:hypothetical protein
MVQLSFLPGLDSSGNSAIIFAFFHDIVSIFAIYIDNCNDVSRWSLGEVVMVYFKHYSGICLRG